MVVMSPLNSVVPPDVAKLFDEAREGIISGKVVPFKGPIKDQSGAIKVAAGTTCRSRI